MNTAVPEEVIGALDTLAANGYEAYLVGGCVRDMLMDRIPADYDIATSALPEETMAVFFDKSKITAGLRHGTVGVIISGRVIEITTYRVDGDYADARHPVAVSFTESIEKDLSRRDFTVNAMAMGKDGGVVDPFGGRDDIKNKIIRAVGDQETRFSEDALRIMRALRFSSVLSFEIEEKTLGAMEKKRELLGSIAPERVYSELVKLLAGENAANVLGLAGIFEKCPAMEKRTAEERCDTALGAALLFKNAERAERALEYFRADNKTKNKTAELFAQKLPESEREVRLMLSKHSPEAVKRLISFSYLKGEIAEREKYTAMLSAALGKCNKISDLALKGRDLIALGVPDKEIGACLERLLADVIDGKCDNDRAALEARI